jgi:hypothetical protein
VGKTSAAEIHVMGPMASEKHAIYAHMAPTVPPAFFTPPGARLPRASRHT